MSDSISSLRRQFGENVLPRGRDHQISTAKNLTSKVRKEITLRKISARGRKASSY